MSWKQLMLVSAIGLASVLWLGGMAVADDTDANPPRPSDRSAELDTPPTDPPRGPGFGPGRQGGPGGPAFGPGRGPAGNGRPAQGPPTDGPGMGRGGMGPGGVGPGGVGPGGMGPGGMGPGGRGRGGMGAGGGPRGFGHPGGSPRWPHDSWDALQKNDPEMYELLVKDGQMESRARQLAMQHRRAPVAGRAAIRKELEDLLGQHFEIRQQRRTLELKRLEEELQRLRNAIELRNKARKELVGKRITQLIGEREGLDF